MVVILPALFQNCGGQQAFHARQAYIPVTKLEDELVLTYGARLSPAMCAEQRYYCQHKVFDTKVDYAEAEAQYSCVEVDGVKICPSGKTFTYNSAAAESACRQGCTETYNYEEYVCHYALPTTDGIFPIQFTGPTLRETLEGVYAACVRVGAKAQEAHP